MQISPEKIKLDSAGFLRVDGHAPFRILNIDNKAIIEFCDSDRLRSNCRGDRLLSIPLEDLVTHINKLLSIEDVTVGTGDA
jgi:hypothetical protein